MRKGLLLLSCLLYALTLLSQVQDTIYDLDEVDILPLLPSGESIEKEHFCRVLRYPTIALDNRIEGIVIAEFVIDSIGKINTSDIQIKTSPLKQCSDEVKFRIHTLPALIPAEKNGKKVNVRYKLWVKFDVYDSHPRYGSTIKVRTSLSDIWLDSDKYR